MAQNNKNSATQESGKPDEQNLPENISFDLGQQAKEVNELARKASGFYFTDLGQVDISLPEWLWHNHIQRGAVNLLAGDPEAGKSFLAAYLGSVISKGGYFPDGQKAKQSETVLVFDGEQGADKFKARALPYKPNLERFKIFDPQIPVKDKNGQETTQEAPDLTKHPEIIRQQIKASGASLVIIDPLNHFISSVDTNNDAQMRNGVYSPLFQVAQETGAAILPIVHLNKNVGTPAKMRINGSIANLGAPRSIFLAAKDPDSESTILSQVKNNDAPKQPSLTYDLESVYLEDLKGNIIRHNDNTPGCNDGTPGEVGKVVFKGFADTNAEHAQEGEEGLYDRQGTTKKARNLKRDGYSVRQIADQLGIKVSTAGHYTKGIKKGEPYEEQEDNNN